MEPRRACIDGNIALKLDDFLTFFLHLSLGIPPRSVRHPAGRNSDITRANQSYIFPSPTRTYLSLVMLSNTNHTFLLHSSLPSPSTITIPQCPYLTWNLRSNLWETARYAWMLSSLNPHYGAAINLLTSTVSGTPAKRRAAAAVC